MSPRSCTAEQKDSAMARRAHSRSSETSHFGGLLVRSLVVGFLVTRVRGFSGGFSYAITQRSAPPRTEASSLVNFPAEYRDHAPRFFATATALPSTLDTTADTGPVSYSATTNGSNGSHGGDDLQADQRPAASSSTDDEQVRIATYSALDVESNAPLIVDDSMPNDYRYSASDWWHNIRSVPRSSILQAIKVPVLAVTLWSTLVSAVYCSLHALAGEAAAFRMCVSSTLHSFLVSALGLLLVFRTNSAYSRFNEGRIIWERIHSVSRNLSRMAVLYEAELGTDRRRRVFRLLAAFPYLLHHHIQPQGDPTLEGTEHGVSSYLPSQPLPRLTRRSRSKTEVSAPPPPESSARVCWVDKRHLPWSLFPEPALRKCLQAANRPLWVCDRLSQEINRVRYTPNFSSRERLSFLGHLDKLSQCVGECERIHQTAVPLNYARHSLRGLTVWLFTLPFGLVRDYGWYTGPVMGLTAWLLYGIYQIGYQIEDPFTGSLRLNALCDAVYRDVLDGNWARRRATAFADVSREELAAWRALDEPVAVLPGDAASTAGVAPGQGDVEFGP